MSGVKLSFSETVFLAAVPATAFLSAFAYEASYCEFFGVPLTAIQLSWDVVIRDVYRVGFVLLLCLLLLNYSLFPVLRRIPNTAVGSNVFAFVMTALSFAVVVVLNRLGWFWVSAGVFAVIVVAGWQFLMPLIWHRDEQSYERKLAAREAWEDENGGLIERSLNGVDRRSGLTALMFAVFVLGSYQFGVYDARTAVMFHTRRSDDRVLVRQFGSTLVEVGFDRAKKRLTNTVYFSTIAGGPQFDDFQFRKVGPLNPHEPSLDRSGTVDVDLGREAPAKP